MRLLSAMSDIESALDVEEFEGSSEDESAPLAKKKKVEPASVAGESRGRRGVQDGGSVGRRGVKRPQESQEDNGSVSKRRSRGYIPLGKRGSKRDECVDDGDSPMKAKKRRMCDNLKHTKDAKECYACHKMFPRSEFPPGSKFCKEDKQSIANLTNAAIEQNQTEWMDRVLADRKLCKRVCARYNRLHPKLKNRKTHCPGDLGVLRSTPPGTAVVDGRCLADDE